MTAFLVSLFWAVFLSCLFGPPLHRIANALETHNRWQAKQWADLANIRDILNIKRGG